MREIQTYVMAKMRLGPEKSNTTKIGVQRVLTALARDTQSLRVIHGKRRNRYAWIGTSS